MKRARIIYNPTSGREIFRRHLGEVLEKFEKAGYETSCHATAAEGDATERQSRLWKGALISLSRQVEMAL